MIGDLAPRAGNGVVRLVDDDQAGPPLDLLQPPDDGADGCDLDWAVLLGVTGGDDSVLDAYPVEFLTGLVDQLLAVNQDEDFLAFLGCCSGDFGEDDRLATAGWQH